jgi:hypothetical protein
MVCLEVSNRNILIQYDRLPAILLKDPYQVQSISVKGLFLEYLLQNATAMLHCVQCNSKEFARIRVLSQNYPHLTDALFVENDWIVRCE